MPKTLEEALEVIKQITGERDDFKTKFEKSDADKKKILDEKKELVDKLFSDEDREGMTDSEKKLADLLEGERAERKKLEDQIKADTESRNATENKRITDGIKARIEKIAKGDTKVAEALTANFALLEKMPKNTDADLDAVATAAYNMLGKPEANPLNAPTNGGGNPDVKDKTSFAETDTGKQVGSKLGLTFTEKKEGEGDK